MSCGCTISDPPLGDPVPVCQMGMINISVDVQCDFDVLAVYAEAYEDGTSPPDPQFLLTQEPGTDTWSGQIPGFCDTFDIVVEVDCQDPDDPMNNYTTTISSGPYTGQCGNGGNGGAIAAGQDLAPPPPGKKQCKREHAGLVRLCKKLGIRKSDYYRWLRPSRITPETTEDPVEAPPPKAVAARQRQR